MSLSPRVSSNPPKLKQNPTSIQSFSGLSSVLSGETRPVVKGKLYNTLKTPQNLRQEPQEPEASPSPAPAPQQSQNLPKRKYTKQEKPPLPHLRDHSSYESLLDALPRRIREDTKKLLQIMRRRVRARLTDAYLSAALEVSVGTIKNRMRVWEQIGLVVRMTKKPEKTPAGWIQHRVLALIKPKTPCSQKLSATEKSQGNLGKDSKVEKGKHPYSHSSFAEYCSRKITEVPYRAWAWVVSQLAETPRDGRYAMSKRFWEQFVQYNPERVESVFWNLSEMNPKEVRKPLGWVISELRVR